MPARLRRGRRGTVPGASTSSRPHAQKLRFLLVGGFNTAFGYVLFAGFYGLVFSDLSFGYLASLVASYAIAITVAFFLYRTFVFPVVGSVGRDFLAFVGVNAVAICVNLALLPLLVEFVGVPPLLAQAMVLVCTTLISYFGHRDVSFRRRPPTDQGGAGGITPSVGAIG